MSPSQEEQAADALADLLHQRRMRIVELAALNDIAQQLAAVADPTDLLEDVVTQARRLLGVDLTYLAMLEDGDPGGDPVLRIDVASGHRTPQLVGVRLPSGSGLIGQVATSGAPMWTRDYATETRIVHAPEADAAGAAESIHGLLGVPLTVRGRVIGTLLAAKRTERHFSDDEISLLQALAAHAAIAIDNARARDALARSNALLEKALHLDEQLTAAVLEGGDLSAILERIDALTPARVTWHDDATPDGGPPGSDAGRGPEPDAAPAAPTLLAQPVLAAKRHLGTLRADVTGLDAHARADARLVLERAAPIVALTVAEARQADRALQLGRDIATIDLVSRPESDPRVDRERMRGAGLDPRAEHDVLVVDDASTATRTLLAGVPALRTAATAAYRDQLVLIAPHRPVWAEVWPATAPVASVSGPATQPSRLRESYADAARAARALAALGRTGGIVRADELGVFGILLSRTGPRELAQQVRRELGPLRAEESRRGVPLEATLAAYLEQGQRPSATSAALGIHVNTLYQRLAVLDRVLGESWRERAFELQVLLRLTAAASVVG